MTPQQPDADSRPRPSGGPVLVDARPQISVLIVGYNTRDLVLDCLDGLYQHTQGLPFEVLFVDCSDDGSEQAIREKEPRVRVIDNQENLGYGRGNNFLARHARGEYLLLLNPDTLIKDNAIGELYRFAQSNPEGGAWGGVTRLASGAIDPGCQQLKPSLFTMFLLTIGLGVFVKPSIEAARSEGTQVHSLSGAFMMMPKALWDKLGGFDESFFMYCEETDLCHRVQQSGRRVLITPRSSIVHLVGSGSSKSPKRMLALTRGAMHFTRKHHGPVYTFFDGIVRWLYSASRFTIGLAGAPLLGKERAAQLRQRHAPIVFQPTQWIGGWQTPEKPSMSEESSTS
ncbi:MAG: glycosyltransferase family 2 protein [Planctomycetota bacterium]